VCVCVCLCACVRVVCSAVGRGRAGRPDHDQQHCHHHAPTVKLKAATAVVELLMMGVRTPETCWAVHKCQVINFRNCCIQLVDLFELTKLIVVFRHLAKSSTKWPHKWQPRMVFHSVCFKPQQTLPIVNKTPVHSTAQLKLAESTASLSVSSCQQCHDPRPHIWY